MFFVCCDVLGHDNTSIRYVENSVRRIINNRNIKLPPDSVVWGRMLKHQTDSKTMCFREHFSDVLAD